MKAFLSVAAVLTGLLGLAWVLLPESMLGVWSAPGASVAAYMGRRYGGLFFGYSVMLWLSRGSGPSAARNAILAGAAVVAIVMAVVSVFGAVSGVVGAGVWGAAAVEVLLAAGFFYYFFTTRRAA
jgi:hypothetical protein